MNKIIRLLTCSVLAAISSISLSAEVFTADDLVGHAVETMVTAPHHGMLPAYNAGVKFSKVSASKVKIENIHGSGASLTFTLEGNTLSLANNSSYSYSTTVILDGDPYDITYTRTITTKGYERKPCNVYQGSQLDYATFYCYYNTNSKWVGQISRQNGYIHIEFPLAGIKTARGYSGSTTYYHKIVYDFIDPVNAHAREYKNGGNTVTKEYDMHIAQSGSRLILTNWAGYGRTAQGNFVDFDYNSTNDCWWHTDIYANIYGNNLTIPVQPLSSFATGVGHGDMHYSTLPYYARNLFTHTGDYYAMSEGEDNEPKVSCSNTYTTGEFDLDVNGRPIEQATPIYGTYTEHDSGLPHHDSGACHWVTNGGSRHTSADGEWTIVFGENGPFNYSYDSEHVQRTEITWNNSDVTLDVDLVLEAYGSDNNNVYVKGHTNTLRNADYVDHYELYMVPGKHSDVNSAEFIQHDEHGHIHGKNIHSDYDSSFGTQVASAVAPQADGNLDFSFNKVVPVSEIANPSPTGQYTFYLRAHYKPEYNLTPTFHDLSYSLVTTGVDDIFTDGTPGAVIKAQQGAVVISGNDLPAQVFTPSGACVYSGADRRIELPAGLYIVRVGRDVAKVAVR